MSTAADDARAIAISIFAPLEGERERAPDAYREILVAIAQLAKERERAHVVATGRVDLAPALHLLSMTDVERDIADAIAHFVKDQCYDGGICHSVDEEKKATADRVVATSAHATLSLMPASGTGIGETFDIYDVTITVRRRPR